MTDGRPKYSLIPNRRQFVDAGDRQGAVANGEADPFGRTGADVAGGEDAGNRRFQRAGLAVGQRPSAGAQGVDAGQDVAERDRGPSVSGSQEQPGSAPMKTKAAEMGKSFGGRSVLVAVAVGIEGAE